MLPSESARTASARTAQHRHTPARSSRPPHRAPRAACRASRARASSLYCAALAALAAAAVPSFGVLRVPGDGSCLFHALAQGRAVLERGAHPLPHTPAAPRTAPSLSRGPRCRHYLEGQVQASFGVPAGGACQAESAWGPRPARLTVSGAAACQAGRSTTTHCCARGTSSGKA